MSKYLLLFLFISCNKQIDYCKVPNSIHLDPENPCKEMPDKTLEERQEKSMCDMGYYVTKCEIKL